VIKFTRLKRIGCGCLIIILILLSLGLIFSGVIIRKLVNGTISQQSAVIPTINNGQGQSFTDPKTGATINLGINKVPDNFPKDFPIYTNATITSSQTGNGFWLTLVSNDDIDKVSSNFESALKENGWNTTKTSTESQINLVILKNNLTGYLTISSENSKTSIVIVLGEGKN
jgi:hypothetical protein